jgi:hypothetical protein
MCGAKFNVVDIAVASWYQCVSVPCAQLYFSKWKRSAAGGFNMALIICLFVSAGVLLRFEYDDESLDNVLTTTNNLGA